MSIVNRPREPNGRLSRAPEYAIDTSSPTAAKRLRDAALRGMASAEWGTELGRLFLADDITSGEYTAGKRWTATVRRYHEAIGAGAVNLVTGQAHGDAAHDPDPDSEEGRRRIWRARQAIKEMHAALAVLEDTGAASTMAVREVCEHDHAGLGWVGLCALHRGLSALADHWSHTRRRRRRN